MINRWLVGAAAVALIVAGSFAAQAADLPTIKRRRRQCSCRRRLLGLGSMSVLNAGGVWSSGSRDASNLDPDAAFDVDFLTSQFPGSLGSGSTGFIGGGQAGYNWQTGAFVIGVETDFDGSTGGRDFHFSSAPFAGPFLYRRCSQRERQGGSFLVGYDARPPGLDRHAGQSPDDLRDWRCRLRRRQRALRCVRLHLGASFQGSPSSTRVGWTIGGGVEYSVTNNVTIKGEYLYASLGSDHINTTANLIAANEFPLAVATARLTYNAALFRAGVNFKF